MAGDKKSSQELGLRAISALVLVPMALFIVWLGGPVFAVFVAGISAVAAWELGRMVDAKPFGLRFWFPATTTLAAILLFFLTGPMHALLAITLVATLTAPFETKCRYRLGTIFFCVIYIGLPALALVALRSEASLGLGAVVMVFATVWATDIGAYFVGRRLGGPKLSPSISPGKTWSGAIGGLVGAIVAGLALGWALELGSLWPVGLVAAVLSVAAQIGDLTESALKRKSGVKDSSHLIPGHGGVLDRIDGLLFASVAAFAIGAVRTGLSAPAQGLLIW